MAGSKDSLAAGTKAVLKPVLVDLGFAQLGARSFGRVVSEILHVLALDKYLYGSKRYSAHYNAMPLFVPRSHVVFAPPGGSLGDYSAANDHAAMRGLTKLVDRAQTTAVPWFSATSTVQGYIRALDECSFRPRGSVLWSKACSLARLGDFAEARDVLDAMERESTNPSLFGTHFHALRAALERKEVDPLLDEWKEMTIGSLKLKGKCL